MKFCKSENRISDVRRSQGSFVLKLGTSDKDAAEVIEIRFQLSSIISGPVLFQMATIQELNNIRKNMSTYTLLPLFEVAIEIDEIEASVFDIMIARFPYVATDIFKQLDNESLANCRKMSRSWCDHLDNQKFCWVRMIQRYRTNMKDNYQQWKKALKNTPVEYVRDLSMSTQQFLLENNAWRSKFAWSWSPLHIVAGQGNFELFKYIFEKTKNTEPERKIKNTALHIAANKGHEKIVEFLIGNSQEKNPSDGKGMTPLHYAAKRGHTNVCKVIIESVENKNPAASNGCTPLHLAAKQGHLEIIKLIVETGVDKTTLFNGNTPLDYLSKFRSYKYYKLLCKDYFQLGGMIIHDFVIHLLTYLWMCIGFLFVNLFSVIVYKFLFCELDCEEKILNVFKHGVLVSSVIAFPLTIIVKPCLCTFVWLQSLLF